MGLHLSPGDLARIRAAQHALLSPLAASSAASSAEAWGKNVVTALCDLFDTESGFVMLPTDGQPVVSQGIDQHLFDGLDYFIAKPARTGEKSPDRRLIARYRVVATAASLG